MLLVQLIWAKSYPTCPVLLNRHTCACVCVYVDLHGDDAEVDHPDLSQQVLPTMASDVQVPPSLCMCESLCSICSCVWMHTSSMLLPSRSQFAVVLAVASWGWRPLQLTSGLRNAVLANRGAAGHLALTPNDLLNRNDVINNSVIISTVISFHGLRPSVDVLTDEVDAFSGRPGPEGSRRSAATRRSFVLA